jgi:hypothetical protein
MDFVGLLQDDGRRQIGLLLGYAIPALDEDGGTVYSETAIERLYIDSAQELQARRQNNAGIFLQSVFRALNDPEVLGINVVHAAIEDTRVIDAVERIAPRQAHYSNTPLFDDSLTPDAAKQIITENEARLLAIEQADIVIPDDIEIAVYGRLFLDKIDMNNWPEATFRMVPSAEK